MDKSERHYGKNIGYDFKGKVYLNVYLNVDNSKERKKREYKRKSCFRIKKTVHSDKYKRK